MWDAGRVTGLTTAATVWLTAAVAMGIGVGRYLLVAASMGVALVVLWAFPLLEAWIDNIRHERTYEIVLSREGEALGGVLSLVAQSGVKVKGQKNPKEGVQRPSQRVGVWVAEVS